MIRNESLSDPCDLTATDRQEFCRTAQVAVLYVNRWTVSQKEPKISRSLAKW